MYVWEVSAWEMSLGSCPWVNIYRKVPNPICTIYLSHSRLMCKRDKNDIIQIIYNLNDSYIWPNGRTKWVDIFLGKGNDFS